jgi:hypothetical protein
MATNKENAVVKTKKRNKKSVLVNRILFVILQVVVVSVLLHINIKHFKAYAVSSKKKIEEISRNTETVKKEAKELEAKITLTRKYLDIWNNKIDKKQKEMKGIDVMDVENVFNNILKKHYAVDTQMTFSPLRNTPLSGAQDTKMASTSVTVTFGTITEYPLYYFFKEVESLKVFFHDIEQFSIKKTRNLGRDVISDIISGNPNYIFKAEVIVHVYGALKGEKK